MAEPEDNVIPLSERRKGAATGADVQAAANRIADQLLGSGLDPRDIVSALTRVGIVDLSGDPFARRLPEPRPAPAEVSTYRIRVDLDHVQPPIWRRLEIASDVTLEQLHEILQTAMGWTDSHLHHFEAGPRRDHRVMPFLTDFDEEEGDEGIHERDVRLDQLLVDVGDRLFYEYDFGDGWGHTLKLEAITPYDESAPQVSCIGGRRACPPEDCGGPGGYEDLVVALRDPAQADEHGRMLVEWAPEGFDPEEFSVPETNELLQLTVSGSAAFLASSVELDDDFGDLVSRCGPMNPTLSGLVVAAGLERLELPDEATREGMVRNWIRLLDLVGEDGIKLTQAGYLPPAVVTELASGMDQVEPWMGKANREEHTFPVLQLRQSAIAMGLVRKHKGRLVLTKAGRGLTGRPQALWSQVVAKLPLGRDFERHAGVVALLVLAAGEPLYDSIRRHGSSLMTDAGWRVGEAGIDQWGAFQSARPTLDVIDLLGCTTGRYREGVATEAGRQLARAALRAPA